MENARKKLGNRGEGYACGYLCGLGHTIVCRNWRKGHLEIDIVSIYEDGLHFVEVKSRMAPLSALPQDNVGYTKQKRLSDAAGRFLHDKDNQDHFKDMEVHFDVITAVFHGGKVDIEYFPDAFIPMFY